MKIIWHKTRKEAKQFEAECHRRALAYGQKCERWAEIVEDIEGFGVPVKDRILKPSEAKQVRQWEPEHVKPSGGK